MVTRRLGLVLCVLGCCSGLWLTAKAFSYRDSTLHRRRPPRVHHLLPERQQQLLRVPCKTCWRHPSDQSGGRRRSVATIPTRNVGPEHHDADSTFRWELLLSLQDEMVQEVDNNTVEQPEPTPSRWFPDDPHFDLAATATLVGGQSLLVVGAVLVATVIGTPNGGLGPGIAWTSTALSTGALLAWPLGFLALALDSIEHRYPALQDVSKATQRSVLTLLGGTWKPRWALGVTVLIGLAAGVGEEILFRGILQDELALRWGPGVALTLSSLVFGLLHAVTPVYALLAGIASLYFGSLYVWTHNLAVPMACHAVYDVIALMYAHWVVSHLSESERTKIAQWQGPAK